MRKIVAVFHSDGGPCVLSEERVAPTVCGSVVRSAPNSKGTAHEDWLHAEVLGSVERCGEVASCEQLNTASETIVVNAT